MLDSLAGLECGHGGAWRQVRVVSEAEVGRGGGAVEEDVLGEAVGPEAFGAFVRVGGEEGGGGDGVGGGRGGGRGVGGAAVGGCC